jgi:hypothetical protein
VVFLSEEDNAPRQVTVHRHCHYRRGSLLHTGCGDDMTANLALAANRAYQSGSAFFGSLRMSSNTSQSQKSE